MIKNPYEIIKKTQEIPQELLDEFKDRNTSLDQRRTNDIREPLLDAYIDNRLRSEKPITFLGFIDDLKKLWEAAGKKGKIIRQTPIKEDAEFPTITYHVLRRLVNQTFKDIKPRYRSTIRHPYIEGEFIELYGQIFDVWVEFNIYSKSAEEADELVIELEEFLQTYAGFFKKNGVQEILFYAQAEDEVISEGRITLAKRTLQYTMRFEKIIARFLNEIEQIAIQADVYSREEK